jgi:EAL and modified HD-GYP domain-containing signal transduction protein
VFERDVTLSYKLLRYANSAIFKRRTDISTIKQALVILGSAELIRFLGLIFAANINPGKPSELINAAMTRAKFCDLMASEIKSPLDSSIAFLTGLLSLIDAIVDEDLAHILTKLPLAQEIKDTLLTRKGDMAALIMLLEFIERAEWSKTNVVMTKLGLTKASVLKSYNEAIAWADEQKRADY